MRPASVPALLVRRLARDRRPAGPVAVLVPAMGDARGVKAPSIGFDEADDVPGPSRRLGSAHSGSLRTAPFDALVVMAA